MKTPSAPNPYTQAAAQEGAERTAAATSSIMNNPNVYTPYGSQTYSIAGYNTVYDSSGKPVQVPRYNMTQTLSPDQQRLYGLQTQTGYNLGNAAVQQSAKLGNYLNQAVNTQDLQNWSTGQAPGTVRQDQSATDRPAVEQAMLSRYNQDAAKQASQQDVQLAARGMSPGSQGYSDVQQSRDRARTDAVNQAYLQSGQEARAAQQAYNQAEQQRFEEGQSYAGFLNQLRGGQLAERLQLRNQPINEITALLGGMPLQNPNYPSFTGQGINASNPSGYMNQNYQSALQNASNFNSGLFGLGGAGLQALGAYWK